MSGRVFGVIRPYEEWLREQVFAFLDSLDYRLGKDMIVPEGTADEAAVAWLVQQRLDLLLLPYHKHRSDDGRFVDGIGVALQLPERWSSRSRRVPILMPVTEFSLGASFERRFDLLREKRPEVADQVILMPESQIGSADLAARIREIAASGPERTNGLDGGG
ncbi:MAG: hypothetical protein AAGC67_08550 [Myxococcota bacterium]